MNKCSSCSTTDENIKYYSLNHREYYCENCIQPLKDSLRGILEKHISPEDFPGDLNADDFSSSLIDDLLQPGDCPLVSPAKTLLEAAEDRIRDLSEEKSLNGIPPEERESFPTRMELAKRYNAGLEKLLVNPERGLPYIMVKKAPPGEDYIEVSVPSTLEWVFFMENDSSKAKMWVDKDFTGYGINFFRVVSAICTGITNLIDMRQLARNPNFIVSQKALEASDRAEGPSSKLRRFSLQTLAPIFCTYTYRFAPGDMALHALSMMELLAVPATRFWWNTACRYEEFRELVFNMSLMLDRAGETARAHNLLEKISQCSPEDENILFQQARLYSRIKDLKSALEAVEKVMKINPDRELYRRNRYRLMENIPLDDPYLQPACPDTERLFKLQEGDLGLGEKKIFLEHIKACDQCRKWRDVIREFSMIQSGEREVV